MPANPTTIIVPSETAQVERDVAMRRDGSHTKHLDQLTEQSILAPEDDGQVPKVLENLSDIQRLDPRWQRCSCSIFHALDRPRKCPVCHMAPHRCHSGQSVDETICGSYLFLHRS